MSMFRKPGEDSDSSFEDSCDQTEQDDEQSQQDPVLSRIQTLESATSVQSSTTRPRPRMDVRQGSAHDVRDLMLHALLEEKAINDTAKQYGKDTSDPEVQRRGRELYQEIARQIANNVDDTYASDALRSHRATAQAGISQLTQSNLNRLAVAPPGSSTSRALVARTISNLTMSIPQQPSPGFELLSGLSTPATLQLRGYPDLQTDRYAREFSELAMVGKGGYGRVYKAKHKLDGSIYAVKRIPISPAKLARVQEHGPQELESLLEEVRSLARFEHMNIVRYHNAWLEFTTMPNNNPIPSTTTVFRNDRLLEGVPMLSTSPMSNNFLPSQMTDLSLSERTSMNEDICGDGIVFENSDTGGNTERSRNDTDSHSFRAQLLKSAKLRNRRGSQASQATIATLSSTKSRMSAVEDVDEEDDIEMIPRSYVAYSEEKTSDLSESMVSHSDVPGHIVPLPTAGPILTLNVQMSLCETNLATFVSADQFQLPSHGGERHCFHPYISLELLQHIISGVQYLHSKGVVHRDLKPANVFLSFSDSYHAPYGSVDVSTCKSCTDRASLHITPRIGDFGLVAALSDSGAATDSTIKPVGTEFYRPDISSRICEKLDVFALGIIGFEMLEKFDTRMERITALGALRHGTFPVDFASNIGSSGSIVQNLISGMVHVNENERLSCEEVRREIARLLLQSQS